VRTERNYRKIEGEGERDEGGSRGGGGIEREVIGGQKGWGEPHLRTRNKGESGGGGGGAFSGEGKKKRGGSIRREGEGEEAGVGDEGGEGVGGGKEGTYL